MADNRFNQAHGYHGMAPMGPGMNNMSTVRGTYVQPNMPMNPMMQQQMMMRFPMQGMQMGPPNTPPPPYSAHQPPGMNMINQPRTTLSKSKGAHQKSEKERFFEEQRQKLRQFGRPGAKKVDTDSLIGSMFKVDAKPAAQKAKGKAMPGASKANTEDDGFGEFLQGPALDPSVTTESFEDSSANALTDAFEENGDPSKVPMEEKKDLTSMMMECSDLTAPQKAKGFHKPTLNEVHRPKHHDNHRRSSFHESDHSIKWKSAKDLDGLFQVPAHTVAAPVPSQQPFPGQQVPPGGTPTAVASNAFLAQGQMPPMPTHVIDPVTASTMPNNFGYGNQPQQPFGPPPTGPPPSYGEATASPTDPITSSAANQTFVQPQITPSSNGMFAPPTSSAGPTTLPEWCSYNENQVPPVYKQILEASLVEGKIATDRLYPILLLSGLPREKLAHIWSLCNLGTPGLLIKTELWLILALIALTQNNYDTSRVDILVRCPVPPIPAFPTGQNPNPVQQPTSPLPSTTGQQPQPPSHPVPLGGEQIPQSMSSAANVPTPLVQSPLPSSTTPPQFSPLTQPVGGSGVSSQAATEDDFADFQAAPVGTLAAATATSFNGTNMQQEDSFGEFIGGGSSGPGGGGGSGFASYNYVGGGGVTTSEGVESDPLDFPPYLPPRHCGEREHRISSMGNGHLPSCPSSHSHQRSDHHHQRHHHHHHNNNHHHHHNHQQQHLNHHSHCHNHLPQQQPPPPPQQNPVLHHHDLCQIDTLDDTASAPGPHAIVVDNNLPPVPLSSAGMPAGLSSISLDDKYSGNVRSFFCSSDSSTGHTSPSFEDDDFTDGRDSFSQVSTSEQSEIDDIHNFEHYVEEFNHSKKAAAAAADGSPLHCPFPAVQPNTSLDKQGLALRNGAQPPAEKGLESSQQQQEELPHYSAPPSSSANVSKLKDIQIPPPLHSYTQNTFPLNPPTSSNPTSANHAGDDDFEDFADFKSASSSSTSTATVTQSASDRYGALRDLTQETDLMQSSVFEVPETSEENPTGEMKSENGEVSNQDEEEEEWANFTEAAAPTSFPNVNDGEIGVGNQNDNHFSSAPDTPSLQTTDMTQQQTPTLNTKEGILKLFQTSSTPTSSSEGISAMVNSDSGYSTRSWGNNKSSDSTLTLTSTFDLSSPSPSGGSGGDLKVDDPSSGDDGQSLWNDKHITDSGIETHWGNIGGTHKIGNIDDQPKPDGQEGEDDWGDFSTTSSSANASLPYTTVGHADSDDTNSAELPNLHDSFAGSFGMANPMPATSMDVAGFSKSAESWANFSGASLGGANDLSGDANGANFVTIKKQNLGTNEIMGLFKVRDDPATMSGYQLPPTHTSPSSPASTGKSTGRSRKSSKRSQGRQVSSDLDDDMMPPPMDSDGDEGDDDHAFSRGYDLDDFMQQPPPATNYSLFGSTVTSPVYSQAKGKSTLKLKDNKEDSGSVNSLELPSATQAFDGSTGIGGGAGGGGDTHSMSSMDLGTTNSGGMVSAESKSLDSLDFKTNESPTPTESTEESGKEGPQQQQKQHQQHVPPSIAQPIQPQELLASMPKLADKYNIDGIAQGNDRYSYEWERCLEQCSLILTGANTIFNNISSSAICNEVLKSQQGWEYVSCVIEIYRVACRLMTAMRSTAISSSDLEQKLKEIDLMWNNLSAFLVGAALLPDPSSLVFTSAVLKSDQDPSPSPVKTLSACGICLLNVDVPTTTATTTSTSSSTSDSLSLLSSLTSSTLPSACVGSSITTGVNSKLSFAGRNYHSTCANFWVNCVDQTLPSLVLPDLI